MVVRGKYGTTIGEQKMQLDYDERQMIKMALIISKRTPTMHKLLARMHSDSLELKDPEEKNCVVNALKYYLDTIQKSESIHPRYVTNRTNVINRLLERLDIHFYWN